MADAARKNLVTCSVNDCDQHKAICRTCLRMSSEFCGQHGVENNTWRSDGVFYYHAGEEVPSNYAWSKPEEKKCGGRICIACFKKDAVMAKKCFSFASRGKCDFEFDTTKCEDCNPDCHGYRPHMGSCGACYALETEQQTCPVCSSVRKGTYECFVCKEKVCNECRPSTNVDISPMTLYPGTPQYAVAITVPACSSCMKTRSIRDVQDIARAGNHRP